jgi:hypothetical protein
MQFIHKAAVLRKTGDYLSEKGFTLTVIGNENISRIGAKVVGPDEKIYLYTSDNTDILALVEWAIKIRHAQFPPSPLN